ncbi:hypothetical protein BDZ85DRAFT_265290 [Elsinoe ampelina]|uniref:Uncharacterized protein n=1 Tax=Elsinoe ampelina TaxID=302913 RepID=A0A6A6G735_9PEZI|nr:hypothetical protein BDZ85DRAFT_265290 [Elsinoe ampelina]
MVPEALLGHTLVSVCPVAGRICHGIEESWLVWYAVSSGKRFAAVTLHHVAGSFIALSPVSPPNLISGLLLCLSACSLLDPSAEEIPNTSVDLDAGLSAGRYPSVPAGLLSGVPAGLSSSVPAGLLSSVPAGLLSSLPAGLLSSVPARLLSGPLTRPVCKVDSEVDLYS